MKSCEVYNKDEVIRWLTEHLDNGIHGASNGISEGDNDMPKRLGAKVKVNGQDRWIHGYSMQELFENYVALLVREGLVEVVDEDNDVPTLRNYLKSYYETFKQNQQSNTVVNRDRIIRNHIDPAFGSKRLDRIRTSDIQRWFNDLGKTHSKETVLKIKNIMSPVFDAAVEDEIIDRNPMASKRIEIHGKDTVHHKAIPKDIMEDIRSRLCELEERERLMAAMLCYTGMRFEEVLGTKWEDFDFGTKHQIAVRRAVVHPNRNSPEVKCPKTKTSERLIPICEGLQVVLGPLNRKTGFVLYSKKSTNRNLPLSYSESRRSFDKIRKHFGIQEYSAHDFRDTCATEWRENGMPLDVIARILGHSKTETTEKRYVKYRNEMFEEMRGLM